MTEIIENEKEIMEIESKLAYLLANVYMKIPWSKIHVQNAHKFFIDRIRASTNVSNIKEYFDVLCRKTNVEMVVVDIKILDFLMEHNVEVMKLLRKESLYMTNFALETVEELKKPTKKE